MTVHESFHRLAKLYEGLSAEQLQKWYGSDRIAHNDYCFATHRVRKVLGTFSPWYTESELRAEIAAAEKPTWQQQVVDALKKSPDFEIDEADDQIVQTIFWTIDHFGAISVKCPSYSNFIDDVRDHDRLVDVLNAAGLDQYKRIVPKFMPTVEGDAIRFEDEDGYWWYRHYKTSNYHRLDGPVDKSGNHWVNGEYYTESEYADAVAKYKEAHGV